MVQIIPRVIFTLPSTISKKENDLYNLSILISSLFLPSAPMETNLTPLLAMKSRALLTLAILWNLKSCTNNFPGSKMHHWLFIQVDKGLKKWRWKLPISGCTLTSSCLCQAWAGSRLRSPPAAAWASGHFWSPPRCSQSGSQLFLSESWPRLWRSEQK